jgi:anthranilate synthase/aminodeoxychorismate synthase-like glutamine amidotransferase
MIIVIDNYDSFVYNLAQYLGELGWQPLVVRNDRIGLPEIEKLAPSHIIISPGPCTPLEAGVSNAVVRHFGGKIPLLGVCLGHQCIGQVYGGRVVHAPLPTHGKSSAIFHDGKRVYRGLSSPIEGGRYHSLMVEEVESTPLVVTARSADGIIMGIRHAEYTVEGIQYHPESIMTNSGHDLLRNFLRYDSGFWPQDPEA